MTNKRWLIAVITLIAASILGIGGIVVYGTIQLPVDRKNADLKACDTFALAVMNARSKTVELLSKNPPESDANAAQAYLDEVDRGIDKAFTQAASKSDVANALAQLGLARISYDATQGFDAISALENSYETVKAACSVVEPTPTASPSAS